MQRFLVLLFGLLAVHAGCSTHTLSPPQPGPTGPTTEPPTTRVVPRTLTLTGFTETLANGYVVGVLVRNDDQHDRVVLTSASAFHEVRFVYATGEMFDRVSPRDRSVSDASCALTEGVLLHPGEALRLAETFVEADAKEVIATYELVVSEAGAAQPVTTRHVHLRAELGEPADLPASASPPQLAVTGQHVFLSADARLLVGVRVRNDGAAPVLIPAFGLLHAAASVGEGEFFPLVGRSSPGACPLCSSGPGPALCDGAEGVLIAPGEVITLVAGQEESDSESAPAVAGAQALVSYLFDGHSLICDVPAVRSAGEFSATLQSLR